MLKAYMTRVEFPCSIQGQVIEVVPPFFTLRSTKCPTGVSMVAQPRSTICGILGDIFVNQGRGMIQFPAFVAKSAQKTQRHATLPKK
jgi:hypothetical protein